MIKQMCVIGMAAVFTPLAQAQTTWFVDDDNCPGPGSGTVAIAPACMSCGA